MAYAQRSKTFDGKSEHARQNDGVTTTAENPLTTVSVREGYDLAATSFDQWEWCRFWQRNEAPLVQEWIAQLQPGLGLDAGCGTGMYSHTISAAGHRCIAIDLSAPMIQVLRKK